jgi:predicted RNA-binding Zn-ribbon protein involved in translation (DUF1610 family)
MRLTISKYETPPRLKAGFLCYESQKNSPGILVNVSGNHYNSDMFKSYWYVCTSCDASIEIVSKGIHFQDPSCNCSDPAVVWCQTSVVESSTNQTKEEQMETTTPAVTVPDTYNPNLLVTYKVIHGYSDAEYATDKVTSIEWDLHNARQAQKRVGVFEDKVNTVKDIIGEAYADSQDQDTLRAIAEALGIELTRTVEWTASIEVSGTIEIDLLSDYDTDYELESEITDSIYADSHHGNIEINDQEVCNVREA